MDSKLNNLEKYPKEKKNILKIFTIIAVVFLALFFIRFVIGGPEDDWICVEGEWIKHGMPSAPMPTGPCD